MQYSDYWNIEWPEAPLINNVNSLIAQLSDDHHQDLLPTPITIFSDLSLSYIWLPIEGNLLYELALAWYRTILHTYT